MADQYVHSTSYPPLWGDVTGPVFKYSPPGPLPYDDLLSLQASGENPGAAFKADEYVRLGDGTYATWNGATWGAYTPPAARMGSMGAPTPPLPPAPTASSTKAQVVAWLDALWDWLVAVGIFTDTDPRFYDPSMTKGELLAIVAFFTDVDADDDDQDDDDGG